MNKDLLSIDSAFTNHYRELLNIQKNIVAQLEAYHFDLSKSEITEAIIERMLSYWLFNVNNNKEILQRKTNPVAADFFTETCMLFLKSYYKKNGYTVLSEKEVNKNPIIRPDISIWKEEQLVAVIELKVSDGWKGKTIFSHLIEREKQIKNIYPNIYFGVLAFWNFFDSSEVGWNQKYFGLLKFKSDNKHEETGSTIEKMIVEINKNTQQEHTP